LGAFLVCCWKGVGIKSDLIEFKISQFSELKVKIVK